LENCRVLVFARLSPVGYAGGMCGRYFLVASPPELADLFGLADVPDAAPRYNIAPTQSVLAVGPDRAGLPAVASFRWGMVPRWATDAKLAPINARAETAADKPTFAEAFRKRRCLIPASGFYEWLRQGKAKQPFCIRLADNQPFAFAGVWEAWRPETGPPLLTCAILTTAANDLVKPIHDRMPVILEERHFGTWIDRDVQEPAELAPMLRPFPGERMRAYPVNPWVNDARHDDARCLEPAG
jgi:putative SOS response-associated peptidase YedK